MYFYHFERPPLFDWLTPMMSSAGLCNSSTNKKINPPQRQLISNRLSLRHLLNHFVDAFYQ
jgi:hypothetical protein